MMMRGWTGWLAAMWLSTLCGWSGAQSQGPADAEADMRAALALYDAGDFAAALPKFQALAERGHADARYMAGLMHHRGRGTPVSGRDAVRWYALAADQNHGSALANLGIIYRDGAGEGATAVAPDAAQALAYLRRAAYVENSAGQLAYAAMLINARRTRDELIEGVAFMRICADGGNEAAQDNLEDLELDDDDSAAADKRRKEIESSIARIRAMQDPASVAGPPPVDAPAPAADPGPRPAPAAPASGPAQAGLLRLRRVVVRDPMIHDCEALHMLVPAHWTFEGRIEWLLNDSVLANPLWRAADPSAGVEMRSLPFRQFTWTDGSFLPEGANHLGMTVLRPIRDPAEFVQRFWAGGDSALAHLAGHAPQSVRELPALAAQAVREWGAPAEARGFRLRYLHQADGREWEEDVIFALLYSGRDPVTWLVTHGHVIRGPRGSLDRSSPLTSAIYASGSYTSEWKAGWRVCYQLFLKRAEQVIFDARKLAATLEANRQHQQELAREIERDRESSMSARHRALSEALGGIETYANPYAGHNVELPQGYREVWVNQTGEYVLSERPGYDPGIGDHRLEGNWKKMSRVDPMEKRK
jgi:TPR repeat protein